LKSIKTANNSLIDVARRYTEVLIFFSSSFCWLKTSSTTLAYLAAKETMRFHAQFGYGPDDIIVDL
jgi:hypothetical protein